VAVTASLMPRNGRALLLLMTAAAFGPYAPPVRLVARGALGMALGDSSAFGRVA
jgi:hypothetical protein